MRWQTAIQSLRWAALGGNTHLTNIADSIARHAIDRWVGKRACGVVEVPDLPGASIQILFWRGPASSVVTEAAAVQVGMAIDPPVFNAAPHARNAWRKLHRDLQNALGDDATDEVVWAAWMAHLQNRRSR